MIDMPFADVLCARKFSCHAASPVDENHSSNAFWEELEKNIDAEASPDEMSVESSAPLSSPLGNCVKSAVLLAALTDELEGSAESASPGEVESATPEEESAPTLPTTKTERIPLEELTAAVVRVCHAPGYTCKLYQHESSTTEQPIMYAEVEVNGVVEAYLIDVNRIDRENATELEMLALGSPTMGLVSVGDLGSSSRKGPLLLLSDLVDAHRQMGRSLGDAFFSPQGQELSAEDYVNKRMDYATSYAEFTENLNKAYCKAWDEAADPNTKALFERILSFRGIARSDYSKYLNSQDDESSAA